MEFHSRALESFIRQDLERKMVFLGGPRQVGKTWTEVQAEGARFENMVASHLLKFCHFWQDAHGMQAELHYVRDLEKREADFLVTWNKTPWMLVECKTNGEGDGRVLARFGERLGVRERYVVGFPGNPRCMRAPDGPGGG